MDNPPNQTPTPQPAVSSPKPKNTLVFLLSISSLVLLAATVLFAYQTTQLRSRLAAIETSQLVTPTAISTPTPTLSPTPTCRPRPACLDMTPACKLPETPDMCPKTSWKTFINEKYNFGISLPADWREVEHSSNFDYIFPFEALDKSQFQITVSTPVAISLEKYLEKMDQESSTAWEGQPSKKVISTLATNRAGYPAILRKEDWLAAGFTTFSTYIKVDGRVYTFTVLPYGDRPLVEQEAYDKNLQILDSFKSPPL